MRIWNRILFLFLIWFGFTIFYLHNKIRIRIIKSDILQSYSNDWLETEEQPHAGPLWFENDEDGDLEDSEDVIPYKKCRMETCFDFARCRNSFKVYIYPESELSENDSSQSKNSLYQKILDVIIESRYYTSDPDEACIFILAIDTLDRDKLSENYVRNLPQKLHSLKYWKDGKNHLIFNMYSGSWPNYSEEDLGFNYGKAILAKASTSVSILRPGFDISIPLFVKSHSKRGGESGFGHSNTFPLRNKYILAFKGKRYVHGIGSETRNSLYHVHNENDIIMVTTCKHGKSWINWKDERCDEDNILFGKYDYRMLLENSTFCLVPRGRRLGSFRFLEALQAGCIPVILSNGWNLPFHEVIDWNKAVIWADERLLSLVPDMVRSISENKKFILHQQTQVLWEQYFSSIEKIVFTTLEIIKQRLPFHQSLDGFIWNSVPGALLISINRSNSEVQYPFHYKIFNIEPQNRFTAIIYSQFTTSITVNSPIYRLLRSISRSEYAFEIIVVWCNDKIPLSQIRWPSFSHIHFNVIHNPNSLQRFKLFDEIRTEAILSLDDDVNLNTDEIDFAFNVWKSFPDRIVGYPARSHYWDKFKGSWSYTSKLTNDFSIILTAAAFYHKYYHYLYSKWLSPLLLKTVEQSSNCEDILMNFLVSHVTRKPPIKVTQRKHYKKTILGNGFSKSPWNDPDNYMQRQTCLNTFVALFGYMPLIKSNLRLDPMLYKDNVANRRKKYKMVENVAD